MNYKNKVLNLALITSIALLSSNGILAMEEKKEIQNNNISMKDSLGDLEVLPIELILNIIENINYQGHKNLRLTNNFFKEAIAIMLKLKGSTFEEEKEKATKLGLELITNLLSGNLNLESAISIISGGQINFDGNHLIIAANQNSLKLIKILLHYNKDIDVNTKCIFGRTALSIASGNGNKEIVKLLLNHKNINVNAKDEFGNTPLIQAALNFVFFKQEIFELLLDHKDIDVNIKNNSGKTALDLASTDNIKKLIQVHINKQKSSYRNYCNLM